MNATNSIPAYFKYWGKAEKAEEGKLTRYHLLPYHCLDVAAVGHVLLSKDDALRHKFIAITGLEEHVCHRWLVLFLALHDIGKFSVTFQNLWPDLLERLQSTASSKPYSTRHDSLGNLFLRFSFENERIGFSGISCSEWQDVLMAVVRSFTGHHGVPPQMRGPNGMPLNFSSFFEKEDSLAAALYVQDAGAMLCSEMESLALFSPCELEEPMKKASWLMAGFVVLCDWIGSNGTWFPFCEEPMTLEEYWENRAIPQAEKAILETGINTGRQIVELSGFSGLFPRISSPTPLQKFVEQCPLGSYQQLFILEDVTGSGKTEAALLLGGRLMAAGCAKGFFMALPTMATSNAMFSRLAEISSPDELPVYLRFFDKKTEPSIVLAHGARHLSETFMASISGSAAGSAEEESASAQCSAWLADNRKKALLADVGVGTLDQVLLAVLPARFQALRLLGLSGHVLIVDEVHAYDPYMNKLLQNLLSFHAAFGGSAILLSATLPTHVRCDFIAAFARGCNDHQELNPKIMGYPLATAYSREDGMQEIPVKASPLRQCAVSVRLVVEEN